ncbi:MAG TPA: hypothetical protein VIU15_38395 [Streptomyces sp.]
MRVRLPDGTCAVEIETRGADAPSLFDVEETAGRLLDRVRGTPGDPIEHEPSRFGFRRDLDGISLDSSTERAELHDDGRDQDDEDEGG